MEGMEDREDPQGPRAYTPYEGQVGIRVKPFERTFTAVIKVKVAHSKNNNWATLPKVGGVNYGEAQSSMESAVEKLVAYAKAAGMGDRYLDKGVLLAKLKQSDLVEEQKFQQRVQEFQQRAQAAAAAALPVAPPAAPAAAGAPPAQQAASPKRKATAGAVGQASKRQTPPRSQGALPNAQELFDDSMPDSFEGSQSRSAGAQHRLFAGNPGGGRSGFNQGRGRAMGGGRGGGWLQRGNQPGFDFQDDGPGIAPSRSRMQGGNVQQWVPAAGYPAGMAAAQHPARPPAQHYMQQGYEQPAPPMYDAYSYQQQQQQQVGGRPPGAMQHLMQQQQQQQQREGRLAGASAWGEGSGPRSAGWGHSEGYEGYAGQPGSYEDGSGAMAGGRVNGGGQWGSPAPYVAQRVDYSASQYEYNGAPPRGLAWPTGYRPNMPPANVVPTAAGQLASLQQRHNHEQLQQPNPNRQLVPAQVADRQLQMPAGVLNGGVYGLLPPPGASAPSPSASLVPSGSSAPPAAAAAASAGGLRGHGLPVVLAAQGVPPQDANGLAQVLQGLPVVPGGMQVFNLFNINVNNHSTLNNLLQHGAPLGQGGAQVVPLDALDLQQQRALLGGGDVPEAAAAGPQAAAAAAAAGPQAAAAAAEALEGIELGAPRAQVLAGDVLIGPARHIYAIVLRDLLAEVQTYALKARDATLPLTPVLDSSTQAHQVSAGQLIRLGTPLQVLSFLGGINFAHNLHYLEFSVTPTGNLGSGGYGAVYTASLPADSPLQAGLLPSEFVLKVSSRASVVQLSKLQKLPRAIKQAHSEYRGCSAAPGNPHLLTAYCAAVAVAPVVIPEGAKLLREKGNYMLDSCKSCSSTADAGSSSGAAEWLPGAEDLVAIFGVNMFAKLAGDLYRWLKQHPHGISPDEAALALYQVLRILALLHKRGIVHKDVKLANLLVEPWEWAKGVARDWTLLHMHFLRVVLADMGLVSCNGLALPDRTMNGTSGWWAPEVQKGRELCRAGKADKVEPLIGAVSDVWCAALVFIALRCGVEALRLVREGDPSQLVSRVEEHAATPGQVFGGPLKDEEVAMLQAMLHPKPTERKTSQEALLLPGMGNASVIYRALRDSSSTEAKREKVLQEFAVKRAELQAAFDSARQSGSHSSEEGAGGSSRPGGSQEGGPVQDERGALSDDEEGLDGPPPSAEHQLEWDLGDDSIEEAQGLPAARAGGGAGGEGGDAAFAMAFGISPQACARP